MRPFSEYLAAREANRKAFAQRYAFATRAFDTSFAAFSKLGEQLRTGRDRNGRTHVSLAPFFFIAQRSVATAFEALSANQAYAAWVAMRTGVESALIMGKWVDNPANAQVWSERSINKRAYQAAYQGKALRSAALPRSEEIQGALAGINDRFLHPNPEYYERHLSVKAIPTDEVLLELSFFDDSDGVSAGLLGMLHLSAVIQDSLAGMFAALFVEAAKIDVGLTDLELKGAQFRNELGDRDAEAESLLVSIGLWARAG